MAVIIQHIEIQNGLAVVVGTPFKVADVVAIYDHGRSSIDWIIENYDLTRAQIHAALAYYYDHPEEIDHYHQEIEAQAERVGTPLKDKIEARRKSAL